jgi:type III secretion system FlhB-like substrate exporter
MADPNGSKERAERVIKHNEKFNVPIQTEKEEAETFENAEVQHLADENEIMRKKRKQPD